MLKSEAQGMGSTTICRTCWYRLVRAEISECRADGVEGEAFDVPEVISACAGEPFRRTTVPSAGISTPAPMKKTASPEPSLTVANHPPRRRLLPI